MIIDVSGILKESGGRMSVSGEVDLNTGEAFLGEVYRFKEPVTVKGSISNNGKSLILKAEGVGVLKTRCARCMKDIEAEVKFPIDENLVRAEDSENADEDSILFEGNIIEADEIALNSFLMNVPTKFLCKEDCKGLCAKCGADLNEGECGCDHEQIDPRWAGLLDIINEDKE